MGFYIRKSVKAGPFRFNLSKSGVGVSVGMRGLRVGTGPRGHYVHAGAGGFYYRASLGGAGAKRPEARPLISQPAPAPGPWSSPEVEMVEIESGDVLEMRDARFQDLLDEINAKNATMRMSSVFGWSAFALALILATQGSASFLFGMALVAAAWAGGRWLDESRRSVVILYDFEEQPAAAFGSVVDAFQRVAACVGTWHIPAGGAVRDLATWKRNAGASNLIDRKAITMRMALPAIIKCNIDVPCVPVGKQLLYFFPDKLLVFDGAQVGAVGYDTLRVRIEDSNFIEDEAVPSDTHVLRYNWKHPNKSGGPDRRFRDNRQIPVCAYEAIHFASSSGLNELIQISARGRSAPFSLALQQLGRHCAELRAPATNSPAPSAALLPAS